MATGVGLPRVSQRRENLPVVPRRHVNAELARLLVHRAQERHVVEAVVGVPHDGRHVNVGSRVHLVMADDGVVPQIAAIFPRDDLLHGRLGTGDENGRHGILEAPGVLDAQSHAGLFGLET